MINRIREQLAHLGYHALTAKPDEAVVYYKYENGRIYAVITLDYHRGFSLSPAQVSKMRKKMRHVFENISNCIPGYQEEDRVYSVDILLLILAEHMDWVREICAKNKNVWAVDISNKRLYIYENQPGDFCGLKSMIEGNFEKDVPIDRKPELKKGNVFYRGNGKSRSWVTAMLVAVNIIIWILLEMSGDTNDAFYMELSGAMQPALVLRGGEWWRIVTSMFMHFGQDHLINNMLMLFLLGSRLEEVGKIRFVGIYFLSGIAGSLFSLWAMIRTADMAVAAGASGCIYGVIGALAAVVVLNKGKFEGLTTRGLIFMIILSLYYGFTTAGVDNWAHVGGLIGGMVFGVIFYWGKRRKD